MKLHQIRLRRNNLELSPLRQNSKKFWRVVNVSVSMCSLQLLVHLVIEKAATKCSIQTIQQLTLEKVAYKHYIRALSRWPKDNLRPECQFQDIMRRRLDERFLPASSPDVANAGKVISSTSPIDEKVEMEQANALYSLLENRYSKTVRCRSVH